MGITVRLLRRVIGELGVSEFVRRLDGEPKEVCVPGEGAGSRVKRVRRRVGLD